MTTADRLRTFWGERNASSSSFAALVSRYWYVVLIVAVIGLGAGLRLWDLGDRAIHHDESIHIKFAFDINEQGLVNNEGNATYTHDPVYHGPLQYFAIATAFLLGDNNYTARLAPALFGCALIALPFLLRKQLGLLGAFLAALLLAVSPVILYVSRFAREDMYVVFFTMGLAVCMWRYISDRPEDDEESPFPASSTEFNSQLSGFFSYVGQKHNLWLIAIPPLMALSFATKEITPITIAVFLMFTNLIVAWDLLEQIKASRKLNATATVVIAAVLMATGWLIAALWPLIEDARKRYGLTKAPSSIPLMVIFGTMAAPQLVAGVQAIPLLGLGTIKDGYMKEPDLMHFSVSSLIILTTAVGLMWNWRLWLTGALLFYIPFVLLFTGFFTHPAGFWTGIWGSMDYWLSQHDVQRGNQPPYYYFMLTPVYEFLPLIFALGGTLYYAFRGRLEQKLLSASAVLLIFVLSIIPGDTAVLGPAHTYLAFLVAIGAVLLIPMERFTKFLIFWTLAILFALTWAGEKMPWLTVHIALPLAILGAKVLNDTLSSFPEKVAATRSKARDTVASTSPLVLLGVTAALAFGAALIFQYYGPLSGPSVLAWLLSLGATAIVIWISSQVSWQAAGQVAVAGLFAALLVFTIRAAGNAAYDQGGVDGYPQELLIYAQGSPKLGVIASEIDRIAEESGLGYDLKIYIDNSGNIWPWPWYLRRYRNVEYTTYEDVVPQPGSVVLISDPNQGRIQPYLDQWQQPVPYTHMWWFLPDHYRGISQMQVLGDIFNGHYFPIWRDYFIDRTVPGAIQGNDMFAYFPKDFPTHVPTSDTPVIGTASGTPLPATSLDVLARQGVGEGEVNGPADITVDADGNVYIVDGLNHRIVKIDADGLFTSTGAIGSGPGEFADPYVAGQYENHDGPWGIAVDNDGNVYVADTWNHRIQKFNSNLEFELEWGTGDLFGPRDLAIDANGSVLVVDTGNKRIRKYDPNGLIVADYGSAGDGRVQFDEPSSISVAPNGDIFVADYWNQRIQRFSATFEYIDEISMPTWGSRGITDRAYIAVLADGHILATDPANGRIIVLNSTGDEVGSWRVAEGGAASRPIGIATDGNGRVYVTDAVNTGGLAFGPGDPAGAVFAVDLEALLAAPQPTQAATP